MRPLLCVSLFLLACPLIAQEKKQEPKEIDLAAHKSIGYLGATVSQPLFIGKGYESPGYWRGIHFKSGLFFINWTWGQTTKTQADTTSLLGNGTMITWGIRFSKPTTKSGKMTAATAAFRPKFDAGISFAAIPKDTLPPSVGDGPASFGFHLSPGVILRASSLYVIASADVDAMMNWIPVMNRANKPYNLGRGFIITPSITIGFDNAWDLLSPRFRHYEGTYTYTEFRTTRIDYHYDYWKDELTKITKGYTVEKTGFYNYNIYKIDPFIGIGPVYKFMPQRSRFGETSMIGGQLGLKVSFLKLEAQYLQGRLGLQNGIPQQYMKSARHEGRPITYTASVNATEMSAKAGVNITNLFFGKKKMISDDDSRKIGTTFYGLCVYYKYGKTTFNAPAVYTYAGAEAQLDSAMSMYNIESSSSTDARMLPGSATVQGLGGSLDMGIVSLNYEKLRYDNAAIADGGTVSLSLILPVHKVVRMAFVKRKINKLSRKQKQDNGTETPYDYQDGD